MRGRPPKPTAQKILEGNPGKRRLNKEEPIPGPIDSIEPPKNLSPRAKHAWRGVAGDLERCGLLSAIDKNSLALWAATMATWEELREAVDQHGVSVVKLDRKGNVKSIRTNPEVGIMLKTGALASRLASEIGLSAVSRSRLRVDSKKASKTVEELEAELVEKQIFGD